MNPDTEKTGKIEESVRRFYDSFGWVSNKGQSGEDALFRQFRKPYYEYHEGTIERTLACFSAVRGHLLLAGGGDLPDSHVKLAQGFSQVSCLDISNKALEIAENKLAGSAQYHLGSILDAPFPDNLFDGVLCAHVIYHIHIDQQAAAVNELIRVTKEGGRIVIIYSNPRSMVKRVMGLVHKASRVIGLFRKKQPAPESSTPTQPKLYFALHPLSWWKQFESKAKVTILPWDVMGNSQEKVLLRSDAMASLVYNFCSWFEKVAPKTASRWWQYPMIVIDKRSTRS